MTFCRGVSLNIEFHAQQYTDGLRWLGLINSIGRTPNPRLLMLPSTAFRPKEGSSAIFTTNHNPHFSTMTAMLVETPAPSVILGILIPLLVLDVTFVFLRFRSRYRLKQKIRADDWITIPSLVLVIACSAIMFYGMRDCLE